MPDSNKISFIICCNDSQYQKECISYLQELDKPKECQVEIIPIIGAKSMTSGYNQGMRQSKAKYKVYLHQDVFIWNQHFIYDLLEIFKNEEIGMIGMLGSSSIPDHGVMHSAWDIGRTYACDTQDTGIKEGDNPPPGTCRNVEALDGMLLATQYDIPWREELFDKWDFYDISQSFEFRKKGYHLAVPHQKEPWCMHDCGRTKFQDYDTGRRILLQEYHMFFKHPVYRQEDFLYDQEIKGLYEKLKEVVIEMMKQGDIDMAAQCCGQYDDSVVWDSDLSTLKKLVSVCDAERQLYGACRTWNAKETYQSVKRKYHQAIFWLWDAERNRNRGKERFMELLRHDQYSVPLWVMAGIHNAFHFHELLYIMRESFDNRNRIRERQYLDFILQQVTA